MKNFLLLLSLPISLLLGILFPGKALGQVSITCPPDINVNNAPGLCEAVVSYTAPTGTGSGTNITTALIQGLPSGASFPVGVTEVTYEVTNDEGDTDACSFFVTVNDVESPVFSCPPDIEVDAVPGTCAQVVNFSIPSAMDNCGVANISQIGGLPSGSSFPVGESFLDFQAVDAEGNVGFCRVVVLVNDISDPTITCPANINLTVLQNCDTVVNYTAPTGSDACLPSTTTQIAGLPSGATFPLGTTTQTFQVTDDAGNSATCSFDVIVSDGAAPIFNPCPADILQAATPGTCEAVVSFSTPTASDNCAVSSITQTSGPVSGSTFPVGSTTIEFTATDPSGNSSICSFDVIVSENTDPEILCPSDIIASTDPGVCGAIVTYTPPVGTDNCPSPGTILTSGLGSGALFPVGITTETYTVTDLSGNTATCSFDVIVNDNEAPVIDCPVDITAQTPDGLCEAIVNFADPTFTDNCSGGTILQTGGPASGSSFPVGSTPIEFTAEDASGNTSICTFTIVVTDTVSPEITCPSDINLTISAGACDTLVTYPDPVASDNCPSVSFNLISGPASGDVLGVGVYTVTYESIDAAGNTSAPCSFQIAIEESVAPVITCPADIVVSTDPGLCQAVVLFPDPTATDNCSAVTITQTSGLPSGSTFPIGLSTVEFTAEDDFGNTSSCSFSITVEDGESPVIDCPTDVTVSTDPGLCEAIVTFSDPTFSDNCPGGSISQTSGPVSGSVFPAGSTPVTFTAEDAAGNTSECTFNIVVEDTEPPQISCPADINITIQSGACDTLFTYPDPTVTDNCPVAGFTQTGGPISGTTIIAGVYTITYEATDAAGNTSECSFVLTIADSNNPEIVCPDDLLVNADPGTCEAVVTFDPPAVSDPCASVTIMQTGGPASGSVFPAGPTTIEFTAEDAFGNIEICTFDIIVVDDSEPTISCPANITVGTDPGVCEAVVSYPLPAVSDNCGIDNLIQTGGLPSGSSFPVGETIISFEVLDVSGNSAVCSFSVLVEDQEAPVITCPSDLVINLPDGQCDSLVTYSLPTATDNCALDTVILTSGPASGAVFQTGLTTITYNAVDTAGNISSCTFTIDVIESVVPEITCPSDIVIPAETGLCGATVVYSVPVGTDNCAVLSTVLTAGLGSGSFFPVGTTTETYTVTDQSGNTAACSFTITVEDNEDPVFDCPDDIIVSTDDSVCEAIVNFDNPVVTDNCTSPITAIQTGGLASGSSFPVGSTTITFEATDDAGNTSSCSFSVIVEDQTPPEITCPANIIVNAPLGDCDTQVTFADPAVSDNCSVASLTQTSGLPSGSNFPVGVSIITYEAEDASGNLSSCSFTITVFEDVPPGITCPENVTVETQNGLCSAVAFYDDPVASDNCGDVTITLIEGDVSGSVFPLGITTVTYVAEDISGNTDTCSFTVEVIDTESPVFTCPGDITLNTEAGTCQAVYTFDLPEVSDNCDDSPVITQTEGPTSGSSLPLGNTLFTFEAEDASGNSITCSYNVLVVDSESPVFTDCPSDTTLFTSDASCDIQFTFSPPSATDNCSSPAVVQTSGPTSGDLLPVGSFEIVFSATDDAGNVGTCSFNVTVIDTVAPTLNCPESIESCESIVNFDLPLAEDNCGIADVIQIAGPASGSSFPLGITTIEFQATDVNGNVATCSFEVEVLQQANRPELGPDLNICNETSLTLTGNQPEFGVGLWSLASGQGNIESPSSATTLVSELGQGANTFVWSIDPQNGCPVLTDSITVIVEEGVVVEAGEDQLIFLGDDANLLGFVTPTGGDFLWEPPDGLSCTDCPNPTASPNTTTLYTLTYTTELGCTQSDSVLVRVKTDIPNTITPDGDGVNDVWNIPGIGDFPDVQVWIYNRWGSEVFSSVGYSEPFNGERNGDELPEGSYFYIIDYKTSGKENLEGTLNIIR